MFTAGMQAGKEQAKDPQAWNQKQFAHYAEERAKSDGNP
jgi:hypothetical protein